LYGRPVDPSRAASTVPLLDVESEPVRVWKRCGHDSYCSTAVKKMYQTPSVYDDMNVRRNIRIAFGEEKPANADERLVELLDLIGLTDRVDEQAGTLDHGTKQWLEIGMVLANDPKLVLLDEPTAGMTTEETMKTADLITSINRKEDVSIIAIEHDIEFVRQLSSTVTVLHQGTVLAQGTVEEIESNEAVQDVYLGSG